MNRQAKLKGLGQEREWTDMGAVSFILAAELFAAKHDDPISHAVFPLVVQVRDAEQPNVVYDFNVERQVAYRVTNPRLGSD